MTDDAIGQQIKDALAKFERMLTGPGMNKDSPVYQAALQFLRSPTVRSLPEDYKRNLKQKMIVAFSISEGELIANLGYESAPAVQHHITREIETSVALEEQLWDFIPRGGYLEDYLTYTKNSEAPLAYHLFCALMAVGLVIGRKVHFQMGYYRLYPPLCVIILGPSGLRKTAAANIMMSIINESELATVYPEKLTPEVLISALEKNGQGLIYAPELAAFLGRQKYLEGLVPLLTRLQDCPDILVTETIGRGKVTLHDTAASVLMCSTPDWFMGNTPADTFGGGFVARHILIMQADSPREFHVPVPPPGDLRNKVLGKLTDLFLNMKGEMQMTKQCFEAHREWYHAHRLKSKNPEHPLLGTYYQRKPDHVKKVAMCMHMAEYGDLSLTTSSLQTAIAIMDWIEQFIPPMLKSMFKTQLGEHHDYVYELILTAGGVVQHSVLVRRVQHRMSAGQLRTVLAGLLEAERIREVNTSLSHAYLIRNAND